MSVKSLIKKVTRQVAVYWAPAGLDRDGSPTYGDPIEVICRWEDKNAEYISAKGEKTVSRSIVLLRDADLEVGGILWLGNLEDLDDQDDPRQNKGWMEIQSWGKSPDQKAKNFVRIAIGS